MPPPTSSGAPPPSLLPRPQRPPAFRHACVSPIWKSVSRITAPQPSSSPFSLHGQFSTRGHSLPHLPFPLSAGGFRLLHAKKQSRHHRYGPLLPPPEGPSLSFPPPSAQLSYLIPMFLGFWVCQQVPSHLPTVLGARSESLRLLSRSLQTSDPHSTLQGSRPSYVQESHTCQLLPQAPPAWRLLPGGRHSCWRRRSHVGAHGRCRPGPGRSQGSLRLPA